MKAAEWDSLPVERQTAWVKDGRYCACACGRPLPQWMANQGECPDCGDARGIVWWAIPEGC